MSTRAERCRLHFSDRYLGFLADVESTSHMCLQGLVPLKILTAKTWRNFVVRPMSLCSRYAWSKKCLLLSCRQTSQKTVAWTRVLQYANFHTVCSQNNAYVDSSYFAPKCINFHLQPSRFEKFFRERNPRTHGMKGIGRGRGGD